MGDENPNAQIEANLLEGKNRYASAGTTLQDILIDLDNIAAGLQSSWLGPACQDYQDKQGKLTTTVQSASDVLQKGSTSIGKMYDSYIEADEKQKVDKEIHETLEMFMGVFMIVTSLLGLIGPILEAADLLFGIEIEALDIGIEVGEVATDVAEDVGIEEVETLSSLDTLGDIDPLNGEIPDPIDNPPEAPPQDTPADPPLTEDAPPNVDGPSEEPTPEPSKYDSGIDLSQDEQDFLGKLDEPTVSQTPKEMAPQEPVQVNTVHTSEDSSAFEDTESYHSEDSSAFEDTESYHSEDSSAFEDTESYHSEDSSSFGGPSEPPEYQPTESPEYQPTESPEYQPTESPEYQHEDSSPFEDTESYHSEDSSSFGGPSESPEPEPTEPLKSNEGLPSEPDSPLTWLDTTPEPEPIESPEPEPQPSGSKESPILVHDSPEPTPGPSGPKRPLEEPTEELPPKQPKIDNPTPEPSRPQTINQLWASYQRNIGQLNRYEEEYQFIRNSEYPINLQSAYENYRNAYTRAMDSYNQLRAAGAKYVKKLPDELPPPSQLPKQPRPDDDPSAGGPSNKGKGKA